MRAFVKSGGLFALGTTVWAAFAPLPEGTRALTFVIPPGTAARLKAGPIILGSRQIYRIPFRRPGRFQYACSLHAAGTLTLVIAPAAGLDRLRWRLDQLIARS